MILGFCLARSQPDLPAEETIPVTHLRIIEWGADSLFSDFALPRGLAQIVQFEKLLFVVELRQIYLIAVSLVRKPIQTQIPE